jgi:hypothetical protein
MKKRPISEVRKDIDHLDHLDWGIQHGMVRGDGICFREPVTLTISDARVMLAQLKADYPNWEKKPRTK